MGRFCDLPSEVVEKIMLLVPADSLVEFKSLNKFWYSCFSTFINDPKFAAKHLLNTKNQSSMSLLCFKDPSPHDDHRLITYPLLTIIHGDDDDDSKKDHLRTATADLTIPLLDMNRWDRIYHCDGLLLLVNYSFKKTVTMVLCNPVLKESMILPKPKNVTFTPRHQYIGFEHDSRNNKYKCVSISLGYKKQCQVEVYTLGSHSWRVINMSQDLMDDIVGCELQRGVCFRGVCYSCITRFGIEKILSFDMSSEVFCVIDFPDFEPLLAVNDSFYDYYGLLAVWNDSVVMCLFLEAPYHDKSFLFVFTMDKDVAGCWTKYELIRPLKQYFDELLPFLKNDEILMPVSEDYIWGIKHLASFNIHTQKFKNVVFDVDRKLKLTYNSVCSYEKSLVSIRNE
ncbi:putative F-box protein At3g23260 [Cannabis sativa]|uniref:putative F-box protein At3g23260 n=1 Tax=Cannabis sativa TaxID=3483 RepID=UPI0029CA204F|nr:putative F-box protein At3g23260 [Cannabis sativa]